MSPQYAFILGTHPGLSIAEILYFHKKSEKLALHTQYAVLSTSKYPVPQQVLDRLGGTVKIYEIIADLDRKEEHSLDQAVVSYLESIPRSGKLTFALNVFGKNDRNFQKRLILDVKKELRNAGIGSRFVNQEFKNTTSVQSFHEKLVQKGAEVAVFFHYNRLFVARLVASQNIEQYTRRDTGKPMRNMEVGLMPPKLAQILTNLAGIEPGGLVYDPFCGTGGILIEALRMGYQVVGADIDSRILEQADANLRWYVKDSVGQPSPPSTNQSHAYELFVQDATKSFSRDIRFDALVTEGYLGPVFRTEPQESEIALIQTEVTRLYAGLFDVLHRMKLPGVPLIICLPVFYRAGKAFLISDFPDLVRSFGLEIEPLLSSQPAQILSLDMRRGSLVYHREGQFVGREIFRLVKR